MIWYVYIYIIWPAVDISNIDNKGTLNSATIFTVCFQSATPSTKNGGFDSDPPKVMNWRKKSRLNRLEIDKENLWTDKENHMNDPSWTSWDLFFVANERICSLEKLSYQLRKEFQHQQSPQGDSPPTACLFQTYLTSFRNGPSLLKHLRVSVNKHGSCTQPNRHSDILILYIPNFQYVSYTMFLQNSPWTRAPNLQGENGMRSSVDHEKQD